jgi:3-dehydroquinate synthase
MLRDVLSLREAEYRHRCLFFVDEGVAGAIPDLNARILAYAKVNHSSMELVAAPYTLPGGEDIKSDPLQLEKVQELIHRHRIDRHSFVIAVGGGAMLDAVGFAAATAHRGVRHIRVPTTTLAQNDSGVGVKNAVNLNGVKNYAGTFSPPWAVLNDFDFLRHLPIRERRAGLAEAVKVSLIRDRQFFEWMETNVRRLAAFDSESEEFMIRRCAELHMDQIAHGGDPFETGSARPLDFGHWLAHRLEFLTNHELRHGEAVAIGIAHDTRYSVLTGLLQPSCDERVAALLEDLGFVLWDPGLERVNQSGKLEILQGLEDFREHLGGELTITLLQDIGVGREVHRIETDSIIASLEWLRKRGG